MTMVSAGMGQIKTLTMSYIRETPFTTSAAGPIQLRELTVMVSWQTALTAASCSIISCMTSRPTLTPAAAVLPCGPSIQTMSPSNLMKLTMCSRSIIPAVVTGQRITWMAGSPILSSNTIIHTIISGRDWLFFFGTREQAAAGGPIRSVITSLKMMSTAIRTARPAVSA